MAEEYTRTQLRILWHLKRHGPLTNTDPRPQGGGLTSSLAEELDLRVKTLGWNLRHLEQRSLILRTYKHGLRRFADNGYNPMIRLELVDPTMYLPPCPAPLPLAAVMARENEEMGHRDEHEPSAEQIILALLKRNDELQGQIVKLQDIVSAQADQLVAASKPKPRQRVRDALTPEQWEALRH